MQEWNHHGTRMMFHSIIKEDIMVKLYSETIKDNETNHLIIFEPLPLEPHHMDDDCYYGYTVTTYELEKEPVSSEPDIMLMVYRPSNGQTVKTMHKTIVWLKYFEIMTMYEDPLKFYKKHFDENKHLIR